MMLNTASDAPPHVSAVMPCLNEEKALALCIGKAQGCFACLGIAGEVIVADNGSHDRSVEIARTCGARVVNVNTRGYGAALVGGVLAARGDGIIIDDFYDGSALDGFIEAIEAGREPSTGKRFPSGIRSDAVLPCTVV